MILPASGIVGLQAPMLTVFLTAIFAKFSCATTGTGTLMPFHITCSLQATHSTIIVEELAEFEALPS